METKHTKEYAEKLALKNYPILDGFENFKNNHYNSIERIAFTSGYMKAIEEIAAPELLQVLIKIQKDLEQNIILPSTQKLIEEAINKATK